MEKESWIWTISIVVCLVIYKVVDMHTLQWFGDDIFIKGGSSYGGWGDIFGFLVAAVLFWSIIAIIVIPLLQFLGIVKKDE